MTPPLRRKERKKREKILSWLISKKKKKQSYKVKCGHKERSRYFISCQEPRLFQLPESILLLAHK